jgi:nanoRNase/pAp phosphatase (c-di-AMP/oligoRNAs hydrolase)
MDTLKDIVVIYHKNCPDGFTASWAAWKKFGDNASYIQAGYGDQLPDTIEGKEVYVLDFSYNADILESLQNKAKRLVVIDHHKGSQEYVTSKKEFVFNLSHSGAYLTWEYFFPDTRIPKLVQYISEDDINKLTLPNANEIVAYIMAKPRTFLDFEKLSQEMENDEKEEQIIETGKLLLRYKDIVLDVALNSVHFIDLQGVILPAVNVTLPMFEKSYLLQKIYIKYPPVSLSYRYDEGEWKCSLRSNGMFNCIDLAKQFGGSGHPGSAGFSIKAENGIFPFKVVNIKEFTDSL